ncbi:D-arabinose 5-phosphate isomerase GutQ [Bacillus atrophaeus]|nr:D-arabinose 5-phosphate isomerase GutQ [Bacillus atrophaeus]
MNSVAGKGRQGYVAKVITHWLVHTSSIFSPAFVNRFL